MLPVSIAELRHHQGDAVTLQGWVVTTRSSGKIAFLVLRDGTGHVQCVFARQELAEGAWERFGALTQEAAVRVTGTVRADTRSPGGYEVTASDVVSTAPSVDYPITPKEHGTSFLFEHRHLWLRSRKQVAIARVRHEIEQAIHDFFYARGFIRTDTPILTGSIGEQAGELFATEYFDLGQAYLAQTGQLYVEATAAAHGKVYCFGPTFRAEKSKTRRHLTEFWMCEPEMAFVDSDGNMAVQEAMLCYLVERALERRQDELKELERDCSALERISGPFPRISYTDAIAQLQAGGSDIQWGSDLGADDETALAKAHDKPLFVMNYPKAVKAFYMKENPDDPRTVLNNDCLAPEGYG
jgi:asparaginyl-tRNA synthetase